MIKNKKYYDNDGSAVLIAAAMIVIMFVAGMVYNKSYFKQHKLRQQQIENQQALQNLKAIKFNQFTK